MAKVSAYASVAINAASNPRIMGSGSDWPWVIVWFSEYISPVTLIEINEWEVDRKRQAARVHKIVIIMYLQ